MAQIGQIWVKCDFGENCKPPLGVKCYILMYFNVKSLLGKFSGTLGTLKWPKTAQYSPNWPKLGEMRFWREL